MHCGTIKWPGPNFSKSRTPEFSIIVCLRVAKPDYKHLFMIYRRAGPEIAQLELISSLNSLGRAPKLPEADHAFYTFIQRVLGRSTNPPEHPLGLLIYALVSGRQSLPTGNPLYSSVCSGGPQAARTDWNFLNWSAGGPNTNDNTKPATYYGRNTSRVGP